MQPNGCGCQMQPNGFVSRSEKSGSAVRCGIYTPSSAPSANINNSSPKSWLGTAATGLLGQDCILQPGSYDVCIQFYRNWNGRADTLLLQKCITITIPDKTRISVLLPTTSTLSVKKYLLIKIYSSPPALTGRRLFHLTVELLPTN